MSEKSKPMTKGDAMSAIMAGYWGAREELGPMPPWRAQHSGGYGPFVQPMQRHPDSPKPAK